MTSKLASPSSVLSPSTPVSNPEEMGFLFDVIPDGYEWGKDNGIFNAHLNIAMFNWDAEASSKKLLIEDDCLTVKVKDGSGFKTSIGDMVPLKLLTFMIFRLLDRVADTTFRLS